MRPPALSPPNGPAPPPPPVSDSARRTAGGSLLTSLLLHTLIVCVALLWVVRLDQPSAERRITFPGGGGGGQGRAPGTNQERRAPPVRPPAPPASAPRRLVADTPRPEVSLPELPTPSSTPLPQLSPPTPGLSAASVGTGTGAGGGFGSGLGPGTGFSRLNFLGLRAAAVRSVVFVVDVSGSMVQGGKRAAYEALEQEVVRNLVALDPRTDFGLVVFSDQPELFRTRLAAAADTTKSDAIVWLHDRSPLQSPGNGTRSDLALVAAFALKPEVIIFVSDGQPTGVTPAAVLQLVRSRQTTMDSLVTIHAFAYYASGGQAFMRSLAGENGGEYRDVPSAPGSTVTPRAAQ
jgi:hypothetical protein